LALKKSFDSIKNTFFDIAATENVNPLAKAEAKSSAKNLRTVKMLF
jgi:hypothetical protein